MVIEDLTNIRQSSRATVNLKGKASKDKKDRHSKWAFAELRDFMTYKAKKKGVPLLKPVESKNTSRQCPICKYIDKRNRNNQYFECL